MKSKASKKDQQRKRKRREPDDFKAYESLTIKGRPSTGRPGSPHRFFASSYDVTEPAGDGSQTLKDDSNTNAKTCSIQSSSQREQIIHR